MRRYTVPAGFTLVALWIFTVVMLVNSSHVTAHH
jgi:hypothetical protein